MLNNKTPMIINSTKIVLRFIAMDDVKYVNE